MSRAMRRWWVPGAAVASLTAPLLLSGCPWWDLPFIEDCDCLWDPPPGALPPPPEDPPPDEPPGTPPGEPADRPEIPTLRGDPVPDAVRRPRVDPNAQHGPSKTPGYPQ